MALTRTEAGSKTARMKRPLGTVLTSPALGLVIGLAILCQSGLASAARPELPGVTLGDLDDDEVSILVEILEAQFDPCGKPRSLMESVKDTTCAIAPKLANFAVGQIQRGLSKRQVIKELLKEQKRLTVKHQFTLTGRPAIGPADAKVTVVEFFDFQCPHCKTVASKAKTLVRAKPGVRMVYKQFPLEFHPAAKTAAIWALGAAAQGKWEAVHDLLFANQDKLDDALVQKLIKEGGADPAKVQAALAAMTQLVEQDRREGDAAGLEGTPTFFVNGRMVAFEELEAAIDEALKGGG